MASAAKLTIFIKHEGENKGYEVDTDTTVEQLKEKIGKDIGHPADELELVWGGKSLGEKATIGETQLEDSTYVTLVLRVQQRPPPTEDTFEIFVKTPKDATVTIDVVPSTPIKEIRKQIHDKTGVEPEHQLLIFGGKTLQDERDGKEQCVSDYIQQGGSTVHMVLRLLGGLNM